MAAATTAPLMLVGSTDSRARERRPPPSRRSGRVARVREQGVAMLVAILTILILAIVLADMHQNTATSFQLATTQRDRLRAEYMARSGVNLTRMLIANEPAIRTAVQPVYQAMLGGRRLPQLPIWSFANEVLEPFCNYEAAQANRDQSGIDFSAAAGLGDTGGTCQIVAFAENRRAELLQRGRTVGRHVRGWRGARLIDDEIERRTRLTMIQLGRQPDHSVDWLLRQ